MNKIAILMSSYNGEKYISEQLDSICNQSFVEWDLFVRDDGSEDGTVSIIKEYCKKDSRIHFDNDNGRNIGLVNSFFKLLKDHDAEYYMFCDQDDYWKKDKIKDSISTMSILNTTRPCLVHTDLEIVNKDLVTIKDSMKEPPYKRSLSRLAFVNNVTGCTILINKKLRNIVINNLNSTDNIVVHDWWIALVASCFGEIGFLESATIKYRQHNNNVLGSDRKKSSFFSKLICKISGKGGFTTDISRLLKQLLIFSSVYSQLYTNNSFLSDVKNIENSNVLYRIKFLIKHRIVMETFFRTVEFYLIFLFRFKSIEL